jgi:hypothetical protein
VTQDDLIVIEMTLLTFRTLRSFGPHGYRIVIIIHPGIPAAAMGQRQRQFYSRENYTPNVKEGSESVRQRSFD